MELIFTFLSDYRNILLVLFAMAAVAQLFYFLFFYLRMVFYKHITSEPQHSDEPVSIIICAKNEADNLKKNLPLILEQEYPDYEVVVVNDGSDDDTEILIHGFRQKYQHLRTTNMPADGEFSHAKKLALTVGIKAAKNEWLLLTDADCRPASKQWIKTMQSNFQDKTAVVLGYGGYQKEKGLLNNYIRFETVYIALQYLSFTLSGFPYMAVGRNLAYRKSLFFSNRGFSNHHHVLSGDDDLFINDVASRKNTSVEFRPESHTLSKASNTLKQFIKQKRRHLTTARYYKSKYKFLIGFEASTRFLFYMTGIWLIILFYLPFISLSIFIGREILFLSIYKSAMSRLSEKKILLTSLIFDILVLLFNGFLLISNGKTEKKISWK